jgi:hypothetical protein
VSFRDFSTPGDSESDLDSWGEGVTDLAARRTLASWEFGSGWGRFADTISEQWPWLWQDAGASRRSEVRWVGSACYHRDEDGGWVVVARGNADGPRHPSDPTWIIDALAGAVGDVEECGTDQVRDTATVRYKVTLDLDRAKAILGATFRASLAGRDSRRRLYAETWVAPDGRLHRVTWSPTIWTRRRSRRSSGDGLDSHPPKRTWQTLELWDFGVPARIAIPETAPGQSLRRAAVDVWRRRREWRQHHR